MVLENRIVDISKIFFFVSYLIFSLFESKNLVVLIILCLVFNSSFICL